MTQNRFYSSATKRTTTTIDPGISGTTLTVADTSSFAGLTTFPYTLLINWGQTDQEIVNVTARPSATTFTVVRGQDGSSGLAHAIGATVDHGVSARDFNEAGAHVGTSTGVHGLTGAVVGTTDTQTLTNKTIGDNLTVNGNLSVAGIGNMLVARKTADESVVSNATFQDDDHLTLTVAANATYQMAAVLNYEAGTVGDFKMQWVGPTGATLTSFISGLLVSAASDADLFVGLCMITDPKTIGGRGVGISRGTGMQGLVTTGGTAGAFKLQWAQGASDTVATIVHIGSFLALTRVA